MSKDVGRGVRSRTSAQTTTSDSSRQQSAAMDDRRTKKESSVLLNNNSKSDRQPRLPSSVYLTLFSLLIVHLLIMERLNARLPAPLYISDAPQNPGAFIEERARAHLRRMTSLGPRPTGSHASDVLTVDLLQREINFMQQTAKQWAQIDLDVQRPTGAFTVSVIDSMTTYYAQVPNVVVRLSDRGSPSNASLLLNCHFDSVPQSPGASDDAVSCAVLLEILNVLSHSPGGIKHNVIFLFNGAEENYLQTSHGFITQHRWAKEVRAFLNLEACGAGGREVVFQAGPRHSWLIDAYSRVAPHPFASIFGQEVFQKGLIPSDTDFRIFRDYGHIPGLDMAYIEHAQVYHTQFDEEHRIQLGAIQRSGDNLLALTKYLVGEKNQRHRHSIDGALLLSDPPKEQIESEVLFFDVIGFSMIVAPGWAVAALFVVCLLLTVVLVCDTTGHPRNSVESKGKQLRMVVQWILLSQLAAVGTSMALGIVLGQFNATMSWYSRVYVTIPMYLFPTIVSLAYVQSYLVTKLRNQGVQSSMIEELLFESWIIIYLILNFIGLVFSILSSFLMATFIFVPVIVRLATRRMRSIGIRDMNAAGGSRSTWTWLLIHWSSFLIPISFVLYITVSLFGTIASICGRIGSTINPELIVGTLSTIFTFGLTSWLTPLLVYARNLKGLLVRMSIASAIVYFILICTPLLFPYSGDYAQPYPQRFVVLHVHRTIHPSAKAVQLAKQSPQQLQPKVDSGYWLWHMDYNGPLTMRKYLGGLGKSESVREWCDQYLHCGVPFYFPALTLFKDTDWIPADNPTLPRRTKLELISQQTINSTQIRLNFRVTDGPDHMTLFTSPKRGYRLVRWSYGDMIKGPLWQGDRIQYFLYYSHGTNPGPWNFWIDFEPTHGAGSAVDGGEVVDMALATHYLHGHEQHSAGLKSLFSLLPNYTNPVGWTATYGMHTF